MSYFPNSKFVNVLSDTCAFDLNFNIICTVPEEDKKYVVPLVCYYKKYYDSIRNG